MTSEEIAILWEKDSDIDMTELGSESIRTAKLHSKYLKILIDAQNEERLCRTAVQVLTRDKSEYYLGTIEKKKLDYYGWAPFLKKIIKTDLKDYLEADADLQKVTLARDTAIAQCKQCEEILKALHNRNYLVKNAIDWIKLQNGVI